MTASTPSGNERAAVVQILEATTGGTRRHLFDLVTHLDRARFAVEVIASTRRDPAFLRDVERFRAQGVPVTDVPMTRAIRPFADWRALGAIRRQLERVRPDIVHTHSSKAGFLGRVAARLARVPVAIHTPHVFPFQMDVAPAMQAFYFRLEKWAAPLAHRIVCVNPSARDEAVARGLGPADRFVVIENGIAGEPSAVDPAAAEALRRELGLVGPGAVVGSVGRFTAQKGYEHLVRAAQKVIQTRPEVRFVLAGEGEGGKALERQIAGLGLRDRVLLRRVPEDLGAFYSILDLFAMSSLWEGLPYALLDAMACGKAIVATRVGGMADVLSAGPTGLLVPPKDPGALAAAILDLLGSPERRADLGARAREQVRRRNRLTDMIRQMESLYTSALDAARASGRGSGGVS